MSDTSTKEIISVLICLTIAILIMNVANSSSLLAQYSFDKDIDMNLNYVLYTPLETWIHLDLAAGGVNVEISSISAGVHTQDKHYALLHVGLDTGPGGGKTVNVTVSNGIDSLTIALTGAETNEHSHITEFNWDASAQPLTLSYMQTAGGAATEACVMMHWYYIDTP